MIIWINGAYGAGKTTIAEILNKKIVNSYIYDPENIGDFFRHNLPESIQKDDFQDYPEWREWNCHILKKLDMEYEGDIIVPMTLYKKEAFVEIINELRKSDVAIQHFQLVVSKDEVIRRLQERNERLIVWGTLRVAEIIEAFKKIPEEEKINNEGRTAAEVADEIIARVKKC